MKIIIILIPKYKSCQRLAVGLTEHVANVESKPRESFVHYGGQRQTPYFPDFNCPDQETQWLPVEFNLIFGFGLNRHTFRHTTLSIWTLDQNSPKTYYFLLLQDV